jgi:hypothetical protein
MPNFTDVMEAQTTAVTYLNQMDHEKTVGYNAVLAVNAIVHAILAVGIRLDCAISEFSRPT